jgi:salicylate hydroxylase
MSLPFLIAGGGIAGLAAALGLARAGLACRLFEQAAAFEEVGAGLQMSPNGVRALQALGAWDAVEPHCVIPTEIHVRDARSGRVLQRIRLGKSFEIAFGAPYRVGHRADLLAGLVAAASAETRIELNTGWRAEGVQSHGTGATLAFATGTAHGAAAICADGIRSTLRNGICAGVSPTHRGHAIYRGLIPLAAVPQDIEPDCVTLWLYPGGHVVHYPVSGWRSFNVVAAIDSATAPADWRAQSDGTDLRHAFRDADEALQALLARPDSWITWQGSDLPELPLWHAGNLVLTGDAAHATLPYLAQGAVMALEDAVVLARELGSAGSPPEAFARYEADRRPRTARIQSESRKMGRIYHAGSGTSLLRNAALALLGPDAALKRNRWIYDWTS